MFNLRNLEIAHDILLGRSPTLVGDQHGITRKYALNAVLTVCKEIDADFCVSFPFPCDQWTLEFLRENRKLFLPEIKQRMLLSQ